MYIYICVYVYMYICNIYGRGQRGIPGEHLYAHFFEDGYRGLDDVIVMIIDRRKYACRKRRILGIQA